MKNQNQIDAAHILVTVNFTRPNQSQPVNEEFCFWDWNEFRREKKLLTGRGYKIHSYQKSGGHVNAFGQPRK